MPIRTKSLDGAAPLATRPPFLASFGAYLGTLGPKSTWPRMICLHPAFIIYMPRTHLTQIFG